VEKEAQMRRKSVLIAIILFVVTANCGLANAAQSAHAQGAITSPDDPRLAKFVYEIVSIKPFKEDPKAQSRWTGMRNTPDGLELRGVPAQFAVIWAYMSEPQHSRITGGPDWAKKDPLDIQAKMDPDVAEAFGKLTPAEQTIARRHMLQALVSDYFKAKVHIESEEIPIFQLVLAKSGPKMKENTDPNVDPDPMKQPKYNLRFNGGATTWTFRAAQIKEDLVWRLPQYVGRPVYDATGLTGRYDFTLTFAQESMAAVAPGGGAAPAGAGVADQTSAAPAMAQAIEDQLGLKLVPAKGPRDVIVVESMQKPDGN
jgi:uncharacterized protein (TIGR03435 family)